MAETASSAHLGEDRVRGNLMDEGRRLQGGAMHIPAQTGGQIKAETIYMVLLHPPEGTKRDGSAGQVLT